MIGTVRVDNRLPVRHFAIHYVAKKREIASRYDEAFRSVPGLFRLRAAEWACSNEWLYTLGIDEATFGQSSRAVMRILAEMNVQTRPLWQPLHLSLAHREAQRVNSDVAERLYRDGLSLPCSVGLSWQAQRRVIDGIKSARRRVGLTPSGRKLRASADAHGGLNGGSGARNGRARE